ncbi:aminoglycoside phosphotransferase family protein [Phaeobacter gallaeciensis]|uniref:phosphotransferase family protein n=1 Tax=Phaeobacter gallaeciensis TaxID=60890 RepID=UPI0023806220|nr:aminoglycoside phosphotransferase family protein [Phaeobacter gallaeciensis]MDE4300309.1 aminoglycoside phosphotransferase family protein [Phaeobacter gallaeciensis]MDE5185473.1 aminoglycoside phosphotransferase family protein [Phaeobacter gallaeciensis]
MRAPRILTGGRSNHVWRMGDLVVKLFEPGRKNPLFANDPLREIAALSALSGTGMVPHLVTSGHFEGRHWLAYSHIEGAPWQRGAAEVARLLGRLHDQPVFAGVPAGVNGSAMLAAQTESILSQTQGGADLRTLRPAGQVPPASRTSLIHGDPVPGNLVAHDGTLTLIDWQCPQRGDPAEDLALFLSPAMQFLYRGKVLSRAEEAAFLAAYPDRLVAERTEALKPWYHWRMAAYCLWKAEQGGAQDRAAMQLEIAALQSIIPSTA